MSKVRISPPTEEEYAPFYAGYVRRVVDADIQALLAAQNEDLARRFGAVPPERESFRYAAGKWSVRQVLGHMIDAERVFGYRAMCIARGETQPLPGFSENEYVANGPFENVPIAALLPELLALRSSHIALFTHLGPEAWARRGIASGQPITTRALAYILAGHVHHHLEILTARYDV